MPAWEALTPFKSRHCSHVLVKPTVQALSSPAWSATGVTVPPVSQIIAFNTSFVHVLRALSNLTWSRSVLNFSVCECRANRSSDCEHLRGTSASASRSSPQQQSRLLRKARIQVCSGPLIRVWACDIQLLQLTLSPAS